MTTTEKNMYHVKAFIEKLGDVSKWEFTGEIVDLKQAVGSCICGHQIRYEYLITDGTRKEAVGSECINHFKTYNERLYNVLTEAHENWKKERAKLRKQAIEAQKSKELDILKAKYTELKRTIIEKAEGYFNSNTRLPYTFYKIHQAVNSSFKEYKRTASYIKAYKDSITSIEKFMDSKEWTELKSFEKVSVVQSFLPLNNFVTFAEMVASYIPNSKVWNPNPYRVRIYLPYNEFIEVENSIDNMYSKARNYVSAGTREVLIEAMETVQKENDLTKEETIEYYTEAT